MTEKPMPTFRTKLSQWGLGSRVLVLGLAMLLAGVSIISVGRTLRGNWSDLPGAAVAVGVCLTGTLLSLLVGHRFRHPDQAMISLLLGMMFRTGLPACVALSWHFFAAPLADAAFVYYLLLFYFVSLTVERTLALPPDSPGKAQPLRGRDG
jgi:hypothetical protein